MPLTLMTASCRPCVMLILANAPIVETKFLELAMSLLDFSPRIPLGTFSILLIKCCESDQYISNAIYPDGPCTLTLTLFGFQSKIYLLHVACKAERLKGTNLSNACLSNCICVFVVFTVFL